MSWGDWYICAHRSGPPGISDEGTCLYGPPLHSPCIFFASLQPSELTIFLMAALEWSAAVEMSSRDPAWGELSEPGHVVTPEVLTGEADTDDVMASSGRPCSCTWPFSWCPDCSRGLAQRRGKAQNHLLSLLGPTPSETPQLSYTVLSPVLPPLVNVDPDS